MAIALMAWFRAPAPITCMSARPSDRTTPASAPATELGLDLEDTLSVSMEVLPTVHRLQRPLGRPPSITSTVRSVFPPSELSFSSDVVERHRAYSVARNSRTTTTLIWPGYVNSD